MSSSTITAAWVGDVETGARSGTDCHLLNLGYWNGASSGGACRTGSSPATPRPTSG